MSTLCRVCGSALLPCDCSAHGPKRRSADEWVERKGSVGVKHDGAKPRLGLVPPQIELEVADVLTFGANKYPAADNWKRVDGKEWRYMDAALRHINAIRRGEVRDPETGKLHHAHAICCLMFLGEMELDTDI